MTAFQLNVVQQIDVFVVPSSPFHNHTFTQSLTQSLNQLESGLSPF